MEKDKAHAYAKEAFKYLSSSQNGLTYEQVKEKQKL